MNFDRRAKTRPACENPPLPDRLGISQSTLSSAAVTAYVNSILVPDSEWTLSAPSGDDVRSVTFNTAPVAKSIVQVYAQANPQCVVSAGVLTFVPSAGLVPPAGSTITVTSWNDTREQGLLTQIFTGPVVTGVTVSQGFDETNYDPLFITAVQYAANPGPFLSNSLEIGQAYEIYIPGNTDWTLCGAANNNPGTTFVATGTTAGTGQAYAVDFVRSNATDAVNGDSGSFDRTVGDTQLTNAIDLGIVITNPDRLWVYFNGKRLFNGAGYTLQNNFLILTSGIMNPTDQLIVTQVTNSVVPEAMEFRIFQDMRGVQATYRMTPSTTTTVTQAVAQTDDIIHVANADALVAPDLVANFWGVVTIDAERIMYRYRDTTANTISGLLRGTAGTANAPHAVGAIAYDIGRDNLLDIQYQNYVVSDTTLADGTQTVFVAESISLVVPGAVTWSISNTYIMGTAVVNSGIYYRAIIDVPANIAINNITYWEPASAELQVYVGGFRVQTGYTLTSSDPATVTFTTAPADGVDVTILVQRGVTWYAPGASTASNGNPLQITDTVPARFLRGL